MLVRRADVPRINRGMGIGSPGMWHGFYRLSQGQRWSIAQHIADRAIPPPRDSMLRCSRHANFSLIARCFPHGAEIDGALFAEDYERNWARLMAWDTPELTGEEYVIDEHVAKFMSRPTNRGR